MKKSFIFGAIAALTLSSAANAFQVNMYDIGSSVESHINNLSVIEALATHEVCVPVMPAGMLEFAKKYGNSKESSMKWVNETQMRGTKIPNRDVCIMVFNDRPAHVNNIYKHDIRIVAYMDKCKDLSDMKGYLPQVEAIRKYHRARAVDNTAAHKDWGAPADLYKKTFQEIANGIEHHIVCGRIEAAMKADEQQF